VGVNRSEREREESRRPQDADDRLGRDELVSDVEGTPEQMRPPGERGLVADSQEEETKRIDEDVEADEDEERGEGGDEESPESPLAADRPAEQDGGEQS
jgi:hypothetical protein